MKDRYLKELRYTLKIPELSKFIICYDTRFYGQIPMLNNFYNILQATAKRELSVEEVLPAMSSYLEYAGIDSAHLVLRSPKRKNFRLILNYSNQSKRYFKAILSPDYHMNYPDKDSNFSKWKNKLRKFLADKKV